MKYFLDTEFIEKPNTIDLISLGIAAEDGRTYYAESTCFDERKANDWVVENVISKLRWHGKQQSPKAINHVFNIAPFEQPDRIEVFGSLVTIRDSVLEFVADDRPEFWGYYADYDWVVFCWIFGTMMDLPAGWPMYCRDLKQLMDETGKDKIPDPEGEHNALNDALWNMKLYRHLTP